MNNAKVKNQIRTALFSAIIAVLSLISIPMPSGIPLTFQTFAIASSSFILGRKHGIEAVLIYIAVGAIGIPVFSGMVGGISKLFDLTGGFIFGFIPLAAACGTNNGHLKNLIFSIFGLLCCHALGIIWFCVSTGSNPIEAIATTSMPYLPKDILSLAAAYGFSNVINKRMRV